MSDNSSKLLIDEYPLQVLPSLAKHIGLNEAIVLQQIHFWLKIAEQGKDKSKFRDGRWWTYGSIREWRETNFPFWSENTIQRAFAALEKAGLLISKKFNANKYDHTKWYSIDYIAVNTLKETITPDRGNQEPQDDAILINTETPTEPLTETDNSGADAPPLPTPPEKPKRGKREKKADGPTIPQEQLRPMVAALGDVTVTDLKIPQNYGRLCKDAKQLCLAGYTPETILRVYGKKSVWYVLDWRGQKGEPPKSGAILETIAQYKDAKTGEARNGKPAAGGPSVAINPPIETTEEYEANKLKRRAEIRAAKAKRAQSQPQEAAHAAH